MAEMKTTENDASVMKFIESVDDEQKREDAKKLLKIMQEVTGEKPKMWGKSIIGFGKYHYKYASGREGDFMRVGFSPRKQNLTLYIMPGYQDYGDMLENLGKHSKGKSCLYIKRLEDVHLPTLKKLIKTGYDDIGTELIIEPKPKIKKKK